MAAHETPLQAAEKLLNDVTAKENGNKGLDRQQIKRLWIIFSAGLRAEEAVRKGKGVE